MLSSTNHVHQLLYFFSNVTRSTHTHTLRVSSPCEPSTRSDRPASVFDRFYKPTSKLAEAPPQREKKVGTRVCAFSIRIAFVGQRLNICCVAVRRKRSEPVPYASRISISRAHTHTHALQQTLFCSGRTRNLNTHTHVQIVHICASDHSHNTIACGDRGAEFLPS